MIGGPSKENIENTNNYTKLAPLFLKGGKSLSRISGGILGSKSVLNLVTCWTADTHYDFFVVAENCS